MQKLKEWLNNSTKIVFFGGAGVSTESGIPDFRSATGIYQETHHIPPEVILSHAFFYSRTREFYAFYRKNMLHLNAAPNSVHHLLAKLEQQGRLHAVVTQNIDGLHQKAGSERVIELHGSIYRNHCVKCNRHYGIDIITARTGGDIPYCGCRGIIKPDVVLYGEPLNDEVLNRAVEAISAADMLIVAGTSLSVYPAAGLIDYYLGDRLVLINQTATPYDRRANLLITEKLGEVISQLN